MNIQVTQDRRFRLIYWARYLVVFLVFFSIFRGLYVHAQAPQDLPLLTAQGMEFLGGFQVPSTVVGASGIDYPTFNYSPASFAYYPKNNSIILVSHDYEQALAELKLPNNFGTTSTITSWPTAGPVIQPLVGPVFSRLSNPEQLRRVFGMHIAKDSAGNDKLIYQSGDWYDGESNNVQVSAVIDTPDNLAAQPRGYFRYANTNAGHIVGYISQIPARWRTLLGGSYLVGGLRDEYGIDGGNTIGPSAFATNLDTTILSTSWNTATPVPVNKLLDYSYTNPIVPDYYAPNNLWTVISGVGIGIVFDDYDTVMFVGKASGLQTGAQYKGIDRCGNSCGGPCPKDCHDHNNFRYWLYRLSDLVKVKNGTLDSWIPRPYEVGDLPGRPTSLNNEFGNGIAQGSWIPETRTLLLSVECAISECAPLFIAYRIKPSDQVNPKPQAPTNLRKLP